MLQRILVCLISLTYFLAVDAQEKPVALVGATIIDISNYGNNSKDTP